jgi:endonuclease YncB( thermonuclease family)
MTIGGRSSARTANWKDTGAPHLRQTRLLYIAARLAIIRAQEELPIAPRRLGLTLLLCAISYAAFGAEIVGTVVGVADGDTLTLLDSSHERHRVRLSAIDAPEKRQAYGERAKQHLASLVYAKEVRVVWEKRDRYARIVGRVFAAECAACPYTIDVGLEQIKAGLAWHYKQYAREQPSRDRDRYAELERNAREGHVGLWSAPSPVAPWDFRRGG